MERKDSHTPVLLEPCLRALRLRPDGVYVDGTLGRAGHASAIARKLHAGHLYGIDRDWEALRSAGERLAPWKDRVTLLYGNFADLDALLRSAGAGQVDGMLFDLGVSSPQLDNPDRGFSYLREGPLDMRMDQSRHLTASDIVNGWSEAEIRRILRDYGEERYAARVAEALVRERRRHRLETTTELARIIREAMPGKALREKQHPAKRSFQALRIAVNGELDALEPMVRTAASWLRPGGRLAVISFHSLEDRIVKRTLRELAQGCTCPPEFPVCVCGRRPVLRLVNRKPIVAEEAEVEANPRARSAKLRVAEKTENRGGGRKAPAFDGEQRESVCTGTAPEGSRPVERGNGCGFGGPERSVSDI